MSFKEGQQFSLKKSINPTNLELISRNYLQKV